MAAGFATALLGLGVAVGVGAVQVPLSASTNAPRAATLSSTWALSHRVSPHGNAPLTASPSLVGRGLNVSVSSSPARSATAKPTPHPTTTPTGTPSSPQPTVSPALVPTPTVEYQTPTGSNELAWSEAILTALGDPLTSANIVSIGYWMQNEAGRPPWGIVGANNPINVSQPGYGGTPIDNEGGGYYLYSYPTVADGVAATVVYLHRPSYVGIIAALKAGVGLSSPSLASEFLCYSGNGYSAVPDSWGASQGKPET